MKSERAKSAAYENEKALFGLIPLLAYFSALPASQAVNPPPGGGYLGGNTAQGQNALLNLTSGTYNTAIGWFSINRKKIGSFNTAVDSVSREILCMNTKFFATVSIVGVALFCVDQAQSQPPPPTSVSAGRTNEQVTNPQAPGGGHGQVWVNTEAGIYHREGSPFYGTTRKGKYMTEQDAIRAGYKRAPKTP